MKKIELTILKSDVYEEVAKTTSYIGAKMPEGSYETVFTTDDDRLMLERFWNEAYSDATLALNRYLHSQNGNVPGTGTNSNFNIVLHVSSRYNDALNDSLKSSLYSFLVNSITSKWLGFINAEGSSAYKAMADASLLQGKVMLGSRKRT